MEYYAVLTDVTIAVALLAFALWVRTRNVSIPVGIALLYYWSLYGAWSLIADKLHGFSGHYEYLESKMFAVSLDDNYVRTLLLYGLFIVAIEITLLILVRPASLPARRAPPLRLSHSYILLFAVSAGTASWLIVRPYLGQALNMGLSGYHATRDTSPYFSIHQLLNRAALIALAIGFATLCSGRTPRLIAGEGRAWTGAAYLVVMGGMYCFNFVLGNKNEPFNACLVGILLYLYNNRRPKLVGVAAAATLGLCGLWLTDHFRAYPLRQVADQLSSLDFSSLLGDSYGLVNSSNEAFAAHFSMYGVLAYHVEPVWGQSFVSLAASMIPRLLWANRPPDIYSYYAASVGAVGGQGYTIHHATGWYLNFGTLGVPLGGMTLGSVWSCCLNAHANRFALGSRWRRAFRALAPWLFAAFIPNLTRAGIEAYKDLVFEGLLIPVTIVALADPEAAWFSVSRAHLREAHARGGGLRAAPMRREALLSGSRAGKGDPCVRSCPGGHEARPYRPLQKMNPRPDDG